jgi:hypothetical protein
MLVGVLAWIAWDIVAAMAGTTGDTISEVTLALARRRPVIPLAVGVLLGHLFVPEGVLTPAIAFVRAHPSLPLLAGLVLGAVCWSQI